MGLLWLLVHEAGNLQDYHLNLELEKSLKLITFNTIDIIITRFLCDDE